MSLNKIDKTKVIRVFEAFAGIGAQRKALELEKIKYRIVGMAEWYIPAIIAYQAIHNSFNKNQYDNKIHLNKMINELKKIPLSSDSKKLVDKNYWNKRDLKEIKMIYNAVISSKNEKNIFNVKNLYKFKLSRIDLLTYSFPCQDLSQQGKRKGMAKNSNSRSGLLWEIEKALEKNSKKNRPKFLLMENVKALNNKINQKDFDSWKNKLEKLGYKNDIKVLNAIDFGSSQARKRTFMLSTKGKLVKLPIGKKEPKPIKSILSYANKNDYLPKLEKYNLSKLGQISKSNIRKYKIIDYTTFNSESFVYDPKFSGPTLTASGANSRIKIKWKKRIRKLNSKEAFKYMGFEDLDYKKINNLNFINENKKIFLAGNSISIEVLREIFKVIKNNFYEK